MIKEVQFVITELRQMFRIVEPSAGFSDVLQVDLSLVTKSIDVCGSRVPPHVCHTLSGLIVPASNLQDFAVFTRTTLTINHQFRNQCKNPNTPVFKFYRNKDEHSFHGS